MKKVLTSWNELVEFVKANKDKKFVLRPISIYGPMDQKKDVPEIKEIQSITFEVTEE